jgi:nucleotide-binding universal stress UspA family protein
MESKLRAHSEGARTALAKAAERKRVPWSFRTARGHVASEILAALAEADLLAMATLGHPFRRYFRFGSAAPERVETELPVLLLAARGAPFKGHLVVLYDGSPAAKRRISIAAELARAGANRITILIAAADRQSAERMQHGLESFLAGCGAEIHFRSFDSKDEAALIRAVKAEREGVLLLPGRKALEKHPDLESYLDESEMSLLLCDGSEADEE